jgi:transposase
MKAYSMDLRQRVLADCDAGLATLGVARKYRVRTARVRRLQQRRRQTGAVGPRRPARAGPPRLLDGHDGRLRQLARAEPGLTAAYRDRLGVAASPLTVWRARRRLGLTFKKRRSARRNQTGRTSPPRGGGGGRR